MCNAIMYSMSISSPLSFSGRCVMTLRVSQMQMVVLTGVASPWPRPPRPSPPPRPSTPTATLPPPPRSPEPPSNPSSSPLTQQYRVSTEHPSSLLHTDQQTWVKIIFQSSLSVWLHLLGVPGGGIALLWLFLWFHCTRQVQSSTYDWPTGCWGETFLA